MKKTVKTVAMVLALLMLAVSFAACTPSPAPTQSEATSSEPADTASAETSAPAESSEPSYVIGFNNYNMETFFPQDLYKGMQEEADKLGIEIKYAEASGDPQTILSNIDMFLMSDVDMIIDFNFNPEVGVTLVEKCNESDVPLLSIDCLYEGAYFFGVNNLKAGRTAGEYAAQIIKDKWGGELDYLVLEVNEAAGPEVKKRLEGIVEVIKEEKINVAEENIIWIDFNNDVAKAQSTAADFLTAHPDSDKIFFGVAHDPAAVGVLAAVETANRSDDCMIISHGGEDVGIQMLKEGENSYMGTVAYDPGKYGELLIPLAKQIMDGEEVPTENYSEQYIITRDNVDQF